MADFMSGFDLALQMKAFLDANEGRPATRVITQPSLRDAEIILSMSETILGDQAGRVFAARVMDTAKGPEVLLKSARSTDPVQTFKDDGGPIVILVAGATLPHLRNDPKLWARVQPGGSTAGVQPRGSAEGVQPRDSAPEARSEKTPAQQASQAMAVIVVIAIAIGVWWWRDQQARQFALAQIPEANRASVVGHLDGAPGGDQTTTMEEPASVAFAGISYLHGSDRIVPIEVPSNAFPVEGKNGWRAEVEVVVDTSGRILAARCAQCPVRLRDTALAIARKARFRERSPGAPNVLGRVDLYFQ